MVMKNNFWFSSQYSYCRWLEQFLSYVRIKLNSIIFVSWYFIWTITNSFKNCVKSKLITRMQKIAWKRLLSAVRPPYICRFLSCKKVVRCTNEVFSIYLSTYLSMYVYFFGTPKSLNGPPYFCLSGVIRFVLVLSMTLGISKLKKRRKKPFQWF